MSQDTEGRKCRTFTLTAAVVMLTTMILTIPASATFPGLNGKIYYSRVHHGSYQIYRVNSDGSGQQRLTSGPGSKFSLAVSPNGKKIAFVKNRNHDEHMLVMPAKGGDATFVVSGEAPSFSPSGRKLLFSSGRRGESQKDQLFRLRLADGHLTRLTRQGTYGAAAYSPNGKQIVYAARGSNPRFGSTVQLWTMGADGSHRHKLTHPSEASTYNDAPSFSPTGDRIVFSRQGQGVRFHLWSMDADGSDQCRIRSAHADHHGRIQRSPAYSPDGRWIGFTEYPDAFTLPVPTSVAARHHRIEMVRPNGSQRHAIPHTAFATELTWAQRVR
jgi:TolB protein